MSLKTSSVRAAFSPHPPARACAGPRPAILRRSRLNECDSGGTAREQRAAGTTTRRPARAACRRPAPIQRPSATRPTDRAAGHVGRRGAMQGATLCARGACVTARVHPSGRARDAAARSCIAARRAQRVGEEGAAERGAPRRRVAAAEARRKEVTAEDAGADGVRRPTRGHGGVVLARASRRLLARRPAPRRFERRAPASAAGRLGEAARSPMDAAATRRAAAPPRTRRAAAVATTAGASTARARPSRRAASAGGSTLQRSPPPRRRCRRVRATSRERARRIGGGAPPRRAPDETSRRGTADRRSARRRRARARPETPRTRGRRRTVDDGDASLATPSPTKRRRTRTLERRGRRSCAPPGGEPSAHAAPAPRAPRARGRARRDGRASPSEASLAAAARRLAARIEPPPPRQRWRASAAAARERPFRARTGVGRRRAAAGARSGRRAAAAASAWSARARRRRGRIPPPRSTERRLQLLGTETGAATAPSGARRCIRRRPSSPRRAGARAQRVQIDLAVGQPRRGRGRRRASPAGAPRQSRHAPRRSAAPPSARRSSRHTRAARGPRRRTPDGVRAASTAEPRHGRQAARRGAARRVVMDVSARPRALIVGSAPRPASATRGCAWKSTGVS